MSRETSWLERNKRKLATGAAIFSVGTAAYEHTINTLNKDEIAETGVDTDTTAGTMSSREQSVKLDQSTAASESTAEVSPTPAEENREYPLDVGEKIAVQSCGITIESGNTSHGGIVGHFQGADRKYDVTFEKEKNDDGTFSYILGEMKPTASTYSNLEQGSHTVRAFSNLEEALELSQEIFQLEEERVKQHNLVFSPDEEIKTHEGKMYNTWLDTIYTPWLKEHGFNTTNADLLRVSLPE